MELRIGVLGALVIALGIPLLLTPLIRKLAIIAGAVAIPGARKVHLGPIPCWGGLGIYLGFAAALVCSVPLNREMLGLLLGGLVILVVGLIDDRRALSPWAKLAGQIGAAAVLVSFGVTIKFMTNPFGGMISLGYFSIPFTIAWVVAITNALNLVDGLDGLAAGIAVISAGTVAVISLGQGALPVAFCAMLLGAAALGFLPYNFHPARIFMGDTGAMFLGFMLASLSALGLTKSATAFSLILPILILGIPIFDLLFAIVRRLLRGQHIFTADKGHLHHRLLDMGLTHRQTVLMIYAINLILGGSAILLTHLTTDQGVVMLLVLMTAILTAANKAGLFNVRSAPGPTSRGAPPEADYHHSSIDG